MPGKIQIVQLTKQFKDTCAVDSVTVEINGGEFFSLLGPSGCGKTTTLRMIGGFEHPTTGKIILDGTDLSRVAASKRNVNTVFQHYALFPHMSVFDNVAFGLRFKDTAKAERRRLVQEALSLVRLEGLEKRKPSQLSGGQQQRVALARALVLHPAVLLLDEPLGALDAKLRKELQVELKALQERLGITFIYVTHDQEEALTMSDRLAVMRSGRIAQIGTPKAVYERPASAFVAEFLGVANVLSGKVCGGENESLCVEIGEISLIVDCADRLKAGEVRLMIRPERIRIDPSHDTGPNLFKATVERSVFLGAVSQLFLSLPGGAKLQAMVPNHGGNERIRAGAPLTVFLPPDALHVLNIDPPPA